MGKNFCKVEHKWCKFLNHKKNCTYCQKRMEDISKCPRREARETISFRTLLKRVDIEDVIEVIGKYWESQKASAEGYRRVYQKLMTQKGIRSDYMIEVEKDDSLGEEGLFVHGIDTSNRTWAMEFVPWSEWLTMNISQTTLDKLTDAEIVAGCLFEMTWAGFDEDEVQGEWQEIKNRFVEMKNDN